MHGVRVKGRRGVSREEILAVARHHVVSVGWRRTTVRGIAAEVGISRPTLYKAFPSKSALGEALVTHEVDGFLHDIRTMLGRPDGDLRARLYAALVTALEERQRSRFLAAALADTGSGADSLVPAFAGESNQLATRTAAAVVEILEPWVPSADPAELGFTATVAVRLAMSFLLEPASEPVEVIARRVSDLVTSYLSRPRVELTDAAAAG